MAHNYPKWPKNDARIYALFPQIFLTEKAVPQTFLLLECMLSVHILNVFIFQKFQNNNENEAVYTSHVLKDQEGRVVCPALYIYK